MRAKNFDIVNFRVELQPKQRELLQLIEGDEFAILGYGGSKGGAKSHALRTIVLLFAMKYANVSCLIFRTKFPDLNENHILPLLKEHPFLVPWYSKQERILKIPNGSMVKFGYAEHDEDIESFHGKQYDLIAIDQSEQASIKMLDALKSCKRSKNPLIKKPKMVLTFNPGGVSHKWHKSKFVDDELTPEERKEGWKFIHAHAWDNVEWVRSALREHNVSVRQFYESWNDDERRDFFLTYSDYARTLNSLSDDRMKRAFLWGDWDIYSGMFFDKFRKDIHVIKDDVETSDVGTRRSAIDYGRVTVFYSGVRDHNGRVIVDHEIYTDNMAPSTRAEIMGRYFLQEKLHKLLIYGDTNMFADNRNYTGYDKSPDAIFRETWNNMMGDLAPILTRVSKKSEDAIGYRLQCNEAFKEYLNWEMDEFGVYTKRPHIFFKERCKHLIDTLPQLMVDERQPNDIDLRIGEDDPYDACKYLLMSLYQPVALKKVLTYEDDPQRYIVEKILKPQQKRLEKAQVTFMYY